MEPDAPDPTVAPASSAAAVRFEASGPEHCIAVRRDGVYADPAVLGTTLIAAVDSILRSGRYFTAIDYPVLIKALYDCGPALPVDAAGNVSVRFATDIAPFEPARQELYRSVKIADGKAEYYFEPLYQPDPDNPSGPDRPARLDLDEFIADMWRKGVRFGINVDAVREALDSRGAGRVVVAQRLDPVPGCDAHAIEVSEEIHRNDAPRQLANGKLDLMRFQNRFPQINKGDRLLKKVPLTAGTPGFEISGIAIPPKVGQDLDLLVFSGPGTAVERGEEGEFLVAQQGGFLCVDAATSRITIGDKIVSRDGVSAKTTGNLQLAADYEEFGEIQENRVVEGEGITIHADVFGKVISRGGAVRLNRNLVGGSAHNARGDIEIMGMSSGAVIQASCGQVALQRAENCVVSGTRVRIEHAINCDIIGDEVEVKQAEGCAIAARRVAIGSAGPRRQREMLVYALCSDCAELDDMIARTKERVGQFGELVARRKAERERLTGMPDVRNYLILAARLRKNEVTLTAGQLPQFRKLAQAVEPALKEIAKVADEVKAAETEQQAGLALVAQLEQQRGDSAWTSSVAIGAVQGDTQVRILPVLPDGSSAFDLPAREIKARLHGTTGAEILFNGAAGAFSWSSEQAGGSA